MENEGVRCICQATWAWACGPGGPLVAGQGGGTLSPPQTLAHLLPTPPCAPPHLLAAPLLLPLRLPTSWQQPFPFHGSTSPPPAAAPPPVPPRARSSPRPAFGREKKMKWEEKIIFTGGKFFFSLRSYKGKIVGSPLVEVR